MILIVLYSLISIAAFLVLMCMLQDTLTDSHWLFRVFVVILAAGCLATGITVWLQAEAPNVWHLLRSVGLLGMIVMMRAKQVRATHWCAGQRARAPARH